jgi:Ca2+-binding RTX toxin-like protein
VTVPSQFDAAWYLAYNLDVAQAGVDAYAHWLSNGLQEGRSVYQYKESLYLESHADVAAAVARGEFASGWEHYVAFGSGEGRFPFGSYYAQGAATDDSLSFSWVSLRNTAQMNGFEGNDSLTGGDGDDLIYGNQGVDHLVGGLGNDTIFGGQNAGPAGADGVLRQGADTIDGGGGNDVIYGNHGGDSLLSGGGDDTIYGGQDDDIIVETGDFGDSLFFGNLGNDYFTSTRSLPSDMTVVGGAGADTLHATSYRFSKNLDFVDFNPDEGDIVDVGFTPDRITQSGTEVTFAAGYDRNLRQITVDFNRTDFSDGWWT